MLVETLQEYKEISVYIIKIIEEKTLKLRRR